MNTLLVLLVPLFTDKEVKRTKEGDLDPEGANPFANSALATIFNVVRSPELGSGLTGPIKADSFDGFR